MILVIGDKNKSSWSLRPWLVLKHFGIPFEEKLIPLDLPSTTREILGFSPSGKVPALIDAGGVTVWESLAICEYLHDKFPEKRLWPTHPADRALARSIASEMHAGFATMRSHMTHDIKQVRKGFDWTPARGDIERVKAIWKTCLRRSGGPFLFKEFTIADAMYAPVVNRFVAYDVPVDPVREAEIRAYMDAIRALPAHQEWIEAAKKENFS